MRLVLFLLFFTSYSTIALSWSAQVDGPDVFGATKVVATHGNLQQSIVVQCDSENSLLVALIFRKKPFQEINSAPAELLLQIDKNEPVKLVAELRSWNNNYAGVVVSGKNQKLISVIKMISGANRKINAGFRVLGQKDSASFSAHGSTKAMKKVVKYCKLNQVGSEKKANKNIAKPFRARQFTIDESGNMLEVFLHSLGVDDFSSRREKCTAGVRAVCQFTLSGNLAMIASAKKEKGLAEELMLIFAKDGDAAKFILAVGAVIGITDPSLTKGERGEIAIKLLDGMKSGRAKASTSKAKYSLFANKLTGIMMTATLK